MNALEKIVLSQSNVRCNVLLCQSDLLADVVVYTTLLASKLPVRGSGVENTSVGYEGI